MRKISYITFFSLIVILFGCASPNTHEINDGASNKTVLIVAARNMNASSSSAELNELMATEVAAFSKALSKALEKEGKEVRFLSLERATSDDIAQEITKMPTKPRFLVQTYWTGKPNNSLYIVADGLMAQYNSSGRTVRFSSQNRKEYLSIGLSAKPSDTPENHAKDYARQLSTAIDSQR